MKNVEVLGSSVGGRLAQPQCLCSRVLSTPGCCSHCCHPDEPSRRSSSLLFPCTCCPLLSCLRTIQPHWLLALLFFPGSAAACRQSQLLLPEGTVLSMQHHASASSSLSLVTMVSIFPAKGHLSRRLRFFINVCEGKSSLIIMKTIAETPPGEGSSRLCRRFNFRDPLIGEIA